MALETSLETRIWSYPVDGKWPEVQPFSLAELMHGIPNHDNYLVKRGSCLVTGVRPLFENQEEFDELIRTEIDRSVQINREKNPEFSFETRDFERVNKLLKVNYCAKHAYNFRAFKYVDGKGKSIADGLPYQGIITDFGWLAILYFDTKEITILPYGDPQRSPNRKLFYDAHMKIADSRWSYDGNLETALLEFHQRSFMFNLARLRSSLEDEIQWQQQYFNSPPGRSISGILTDTNIPWEQVLRTISQNP